MPDPYASIAQADEALQVKLAEVLELRAADPQQRTMIDAYLSAFELPKDAIALSRWTTFPFVVRDRRRSRSGVRRRLVRPRRLPYDFVPSAQPRAGAS